MKRRNIRAHGLIRWVWCWLLLAVIALSTAIEVLEATASYEERLSVLGINAVGELDGSWSAHAGV